MPGNEFWKDIKSIPMQETVKESLKLSQRSTSNKQIFFVCQGQRSFFDTDIQILQKIGEVETLDNFPPTLDKIPSILKAIWQKDLVCSPPKILKGVSFCIILLITSGITCEYPIL